MSCSCDVITLSPCYQCVGVSSMIGSGVKEFITLVGASREDYIRCVTISVVLVSDVGIVLILASILVGFG